MVSPLLFAAAGGPAMIVEPHARPEVVTRVEGLPLTEGFRPDRHAARKGVEGR
jgi:hypothetical protein